MISFSIFSQQPEYSFKRDYNDPDKINLLDSRGVTIGYYKTDYYDKDKVNIYNSNGTPVGYYKPDYIDKSKINVYSTNNNFLGTTEKAKPYEIPSLTGLFKPYQHKRSNKGDLLDVLLERKWAKEGKTAVKDEKGNIIGYTRKDSYNKYKTNI